MPWSKKVCVSSKSIFKRTGDDCGFVWEMGLFGFLKCNHRICEIIIINLGKRLSSPFCAHPIDQGNVGCGERLVWQCQHRNGTPFHPRGGGSRHRNAQKSRNLKGLQLVIVKQSINRGHAKTDHTPFSPRNKKATG